MGGNIFGNEAFKNLERVVQRGYWTDNEEWMYIKWQSYVARHHKDFRIAGTIAMLKWVDKTDKGWDYMKALIDKEVAKKYAKKGFKRKLSDGGGVEFIPEKKGTLIRGNEIIKYFEKVNGNYRLIFYTLNETKGKVPTICDAFGYCEELDIMNITPKELVELIKKNNLMEYGGGVKDIRCKCGWGWNKNQSEKHDEYVCHKCGTDNKMETGGMMEGQPPANFENVLYSELANRYEKGGLIAPNGKKSNLTAEQYKLVRTPKFKKWFGDWENDKANSSKVVDENGEPMVVYHRSKNIFYSFDNEKQLNGWLGKGFYFSENKLEFKKYGNKLLSVFLNVKNPFKVKGESPTDFLTELQKEFKNNEIDTTQTLKEKYYDGVIYKHWDYEGIMFTCFEPNQIKLADGTNTTFDSNNPDIRYKDGGTTDDFDWESLYNTSPEEEEKIKQEIKKSEEQEREEQYQKSNYSKRWASTFKEAVEKTVQSYLDAKATYEDWGSRQYKSNKGVVYAGGDDVHGNAYTIGGINEYRRKRTMAGAKMQMDEELETLKKLGLSQQEIADLIENKMENGGSIDDLIY